MLPAVLALGALGCPAGTEPPAGPSEIIIAHVGDRQVKQADFQAYVTEVLGGPEDAAVASPEVKSRLLDQFLDEELLVVAALNQGLEVSEAEIGAAASGGEEAVERLRRALLQKKYKQEVILNGVEVSDDEVRNYFGRNIREFRQPASVVLRKILVDSAQDARSIRSELAQGPDKFEEVASTRSQSPDGGQPQAFEEEVLPDSIRGAVAALSPGQLSEVIEDPQGFFIVKLEERHDERAPGLGEVRTAIEMKILREKSQQRYREALVSLRQSTRVEIIEGNLEFPYSPRAASS